MIYIININIKLYNKYYTCEFSLVCLFCKVSNNNIPIFLMNYFCSSRKIEITIWCIYDSKDR